MPQNPRPGGVFRVRMRRHARTIASGVFVEVEPPVRLVFTWGWEAIDGVGDAVRGMQPGSSTVEVVLVADGDGTILRMRHSGLPSDDACAFHAWGWDMSLDRLVVVVAGGDPGPYPFADL